MNIYLKCCQSYETKLTMGVVAWASKYNGFKLSTGDSKI